MALQDLTTLPATTTNLLYATGGTLYWAGNPIASSSIGYWTTDGTHVWRPTGNVGIGTTSPWARLSVTGSGTGTGKAFVVADSANAPKFVVQDDGKVGIGTVSPTDDFQIVRGGAGYASASFVTYSDGTAVNELLFKRARGSADAPQVPQAGDTLGRVGAQAFTGSVFCHSARIRFATDGNMGSANIPGRIVFETSSGNTSCGSSQERMRLDSSGNLGIGTTSPFTKLSVAGNGYFDGTLTASSLIATTSLQLPDGSAVNPALTFTNDTNTGLYRGGNDILRLVTAGQDRVTIDASGNVGIGTTNPGAALHVVGHTRTEGEFQSFVTNNGGITVYATGGGNLGYNIRTNAGGGWAWRFVDSTAYSPGTTYFQVDYPSGNTYSRGYIYPGGSGIQSSVYLTGSASGLGLMGGNIGIGTTMPLAKLDISGYSGAPSVFPIGGGGTAYSFLNLNGGRNSRPIITIPNPTNPEVTFGGGYEGNYGSSFEVRTDIMGAGAAGAGVLGQALVIKRQSLDGSTTSVTTMLAAPGDIAIANGYTPPSGANISNTRLYIASSGNVGIGTNTPATRLHIADGDITWSHSGLGGWRYGGRFSILALLKGRQLNNNTDFLEGTDGYYVYDNGSSGSITLTLTTDDTAPNASGRILQIDHADSGSPSPGWGGFTKGVYKCSGTSVGQCYREGNRIIYRLWAKIPSGYTINFASNPYGSGGSYTWLTPTAGTGQWEEYIAIQQIGSGGTFSSTGYWFITGGTRPFTWYVASVDIIDIDQPADVDRASELNVGYKQGVVLGPGSLVTTNTSYLAVDGGNVGIGTTAPGYKLDVAGTFRATGWGLFGSSAGGRLSIEDQSTFHRLAFNELRFYDWDTGGDMVTFNNGNIGIGTTTPQYPLHVIGGTSLGSIAAQYGIQVLQNNPGVLIEKRYWGDAADRYGLGQYNDGTLRLYAANTYTSASIRLGFATGETTFNDYLTVTRAGNVGIGTTTPENKLHISANATYGTLNWNNAQLQIGGATDARQKLYIGLDTTSGNNPNGFAWIQAGYHAGAFYNLILNPRDGNVGIGTTSPQYKFHAWIDVDGNVAAFTDTNGTCTINPTNTALVCSSDARLKKDIATLSGSADKLSHIRAVTYRWIKESSTSTPARFGVLAQEVHEVFPELVQTNPDNTLSVNYVGFIPLLIDAMNEHSATLAPLRDAFASSTLTDLATLAQDPENAPLADWFIAAVRRAIAAIGKVMVNEIIVADLRAHKVVVEELCVGSTCVREADVRRILAGFSQGNTSASGGSDDDAPDTTAPVITILGNNPAHIPVGTTYTDLGVLVTDDTSPNIGYTTFVDGREVLTVVLDTSTPGTHLIRYEATDQAGNTASAERVVIVYDPSVADEGDADAQDAGGAPTQTPTDDTASATGTAASTPPETPEGSAGAEGGAAPQASSPDDTSSAESSQSTSQGNEEE
ncbi:MAG: hypothetical protein KatS3mg100_332 [Candidatus Parcubacteria bacterium]|nr:MAG: hypothetical protein KatS3mg100_332 [Candidatus Parcubacteria bacterium]